MGLVFLFACLLTYLIVGFFAFVLGFFGGALFGFFVWLGFLFFWLLLYLLSIAIQLLFCANK